MKSGIEWYLEGFNECLRLLKSMSQDDSYESWDSMIAELEIRVKEVKR